jgi:hypothetical protein
VYPIPSIHIFNAPLYFLIIDYFLFSPHKIDILPNELIKVIFGVYKPDSHWHGQGAVRMKERQGFHCFRYIRVLFMENGQNGGITIEQNKISKCSISEVRAI